MLLMVEKSIGPVFDTLNLIELVKQIEFENNNNTNGEQLNENVDTTSLDDHNKRSQQFDNYDMRIYIN
jgi:hypothetical protein